MITKLQDILFIDIETVPQINDYALLSERMKALWSRKAAWIRRMPDETDAGLYNSRAGIYSEFGKVIVIAAGRFRPSHDHEFRFQHWVFADDDESTLLQSFRDFLVETDHGTLRLCAHNGREFDFPYLCRRMIIHGMSLPLILDLSGKKPWETRHIDTMDLWRFGDHKQFTSLELLAEILGIPAAKSDLDGSRVRATYYEEGDLDKITRYCISDIRVLADVYVKIQGIKDQVSASPVVLADLSS